MSKKKIEDGWVENKYNYNPSDYLLYVNGSLCIKIEEHKQYYIVGVYCLPEPPLEDSINQYIKSLYSFEEVILKSLIMAKNLGWNIKGKHFCCDLKKYNKED